jgi:hypothetical protein
MVSPVSLSSRCCRLVAALSLLSWALGAAAATAEPPPAPPSPPAADATEFQLSDDAAGPSCIFFTTMGSLQWQRRGGDWSDAAGQVGGSAPYAAQAVRAGQGRPFVEWDVTALVREWLAGRHANNGFFLRGPESAGSGTVTFHSRESADPTARPSLKLKWADGRVERLAPQADTYLDCTTVYSLGQRPELQVGPRHSAILRFKLPPPAQAQAPMLQSATLYLTSDRQQAGPTSVAVYRASPPFSVRQGGPRQGLAARFDADAGIAGEPDVLFAEDFDSLLWPLRWRDWPLRGSASAIGEDAPRAFEPLHGRALRVRIDKGSSLGMDLRYYFKRHLIAEPEEVFLRYYIRFSSDWNPWLEGGKLPGIAGTYGRAGWGMRKTDGHNGWSARTWFAQRPPDAKAVAGLNAMGTYAYHAAWKSNSGGEHWGWNLAPSSLLENNRWYCIEQHVVLNRPGQGDGLYEVWIDGIPALRKTDVRYRDDPELKIETIWFNVYHGGLRPAPQDLTLYLDQVVVARRYIGPMGGGTAAATGLKHARAN